VTAITFWSFPGLARSAQGINEGSRELVNARETTYRLGLGLCRSCKKEGRH